MRNILRERQYECVEMKQNRTRSCHRLSPSFKSEGMKDKARWFDGEEDKELCFASENHR